MPKDKPKSYGQFDRGAGQRYAGKPKQRVKQAQGASATAKARAAQNPRDKTEDQVRGEMRAHRRNVLRGGM